MSALDDDIGSLLTARGIGGAVAWESVWQRVKRPCFPRWSLVLWAIAHAQGSTYWEGDAARDYAAAVGACTLYKAGVP